MAWNYSNISVQTTLAAPAAPGDTTVSIVDASGLPVSFPFSLILDYQLASVEVVTVTNAVGATLTVTRGQDGTSAQSHAAGSPVVHGVVARDVAEPQAHIVATTNVHGTGVGGVVVGTNTSQVLTNKTISGSSNTITNIADSSIVSIASSKVTQPFATLTVTGLGSFGSLSVTGNSTLATVTASGLATLQAGAAVTGNSVAVTRAAAANAAYDAAVSGDTNPRSRIQADGTHLWGPGNAAPDVNFFRTNASPIGFMTLNTELDFVLPNTTFDYVDCKVTGDSNERFAVHADGKHRWGSGIAATDTVLYRNGTGLLKTDGDLQVGGNLIVSGIGNKVLARKVADQTVNNSTTLVNDSDLAIAVLSGAVYQVQGVLVYNSNATADIKVGWTFPGGTNGILAMHGYDSGGTVFMADGRSLSTVVSFGGFGSDYTIVVNGVITVGANGSFQLQFAQNALNVSNTIMRAGSFLSLTRV